MEQQHLHVTPPMTETPAPRLPHISVCICTYKRQQLLLKLLTELRDQDTGGRFTYSIVIADNDQSRSAEPLVSEFVATSSIPIRYCVEARQNIPLARNKAVQNAAGDFIAFIDDDEFPIRKWLLLLFETLEKYGVDGVIGSVLPHFDKEAPKWVVKGKFYERPTYPTGIVLEGRQGRTNNVLLKKELFDSESEPFNPQFRSGEDQDFFGRMVKKGRCFTWCDEAIAYESVEPVRWKRTFMVRRSALQGSTEPLAPHARFRRNAVSLIAVPVYAIALPFAMIIGQHYFMSLLVRLSYHLARLLVQVGVDLVKEPYVTT
jgi:succinoglycan biosynthesis protein ExoM